MIRLIRTLTPENGLDFAEICSFETKDFVGIWNHESNRFVLVARNDNEFHLWTLSACESLDELDHEVYNLVEEHIIGVSDNSTYTILLEESDEEKYDGMWH